MNKGVAVDIHVIHGNMKFMEQMFVKTFSRGAMTIPKKARDKLGILEGDWLSVSVDNGSLRIKPLAKKVDNRAYVKQLKAISGWLADKDVNEWREMRAEADKKTEWINKLLDQI